MLKFNVTGGCKKMALKDTWEDLEDKVQGDPNSGSEITVQPINDIAHAVIDLEENKVDKVEGKGLSSNDYTDEDKAKLSNLPYRETIDEIIDDVTAIQMRIPSEASENNQLADKEFVNSSIPTKTSQLTNDSGYLTEHQDISGKADKISIVRSTETAILITELTANTEMVYGEVSSISVTFPSAGLDYISSIIFSTPTTIPENYSTFPSDLYFKGDECDEGIFIPNFSTRYTILFYYDGVKIIGLVSGVEIEVVISE